MSRSSTRRTWSRISTASDDACHPPRARNPHRGRHRCRHRRCRGLVEALLDDSQRREDDGHAGVGIPARGRGPVGDRPVPARDAVSNARAISCGSADSARKRSAAIGPGRGRGGGCTCGSGAREGALNQYACITCHEIPGVVGAHVPVGPPLAGIGKRAFIAGVCRTTGRTWCAGFADRNDSIPEARCLIWVSASAMHARLPRISMRFEVTSGKRLPLVC